MASRHVLSAVVALAAPLLACGSDRSGYSLDVGADDGGAPIALGQGGDAGASALDAHIEQNHIAVTFVTLDCAGPCADVVAVPTGGHPPYTFEWDDGSTSASRHVCPTSSTSYLVNVTDTGTTGEVIRPAQTVQVPLTANVVACPDGGAPDGGDAGGAGATTVYWATWTQMQPGTPGMAEGHFAPPTGAIRVTYAGEVNSASEPTGTPTVTALGAVSFVPPASFLSATVGNLPPSTGMIAFDGSATLTQTLTFSEPVKDPLLAVTSLGDSAVASNMVLTFDATPVILSSGSETVGTLTLPGTLSVSGQSLTGSEGTGVVQFSGTFSAIHYTIPSPEVGGLGYLTVGIRGPG
jgi:hypothetical protein